jgi:hypothetical protein
MNLPVLRKERRGMRGEVKMNKEQNAQVCDATEGK